MLWIYIQLSQSLSSVSSLLASLRTEMGALHIFLVLLSCYISVLKAQFLDGNQLNKISFVDIYMAKLFYILLIAS